MKSNKNDNLHMVSDERYITTGEAARICSVTRDTVLKWVRSGRLPALRTAGGHHRIDRRDLEAIKKGGHSSQQITEDRAYRYCWEYHGDGETAEECVRCAVHLLRALRCYELERFELGDDIFKRLCESDCLECGYYQEVHAQEPNVLFVSPNRQVAEMLAKEARNRHFNLLQAEGEYECSAMLNEFRPDYAVVDGALGTDVCSRIVDHLKADSRVPFLRIVVLGQLEDIAPECQTGIYAWVNKPCTTEDILDCLHLTAQDDVDGLKAGVGVQARLGKADLTRAK